MFRMFDTFASRSSPRHRVEFDESQMDIDQPDPHPYGRIAQYSIPHDDSGPARKRLHSEMQTPLRPFKAPSTGGHTLYLDQDKTPFLFHVAGVEVQPQPPAVPQVSSFRQIDIKDGKLDFGFGESTAPHSSYVEDIEMKDSESPARPLKRLEVDNNTQETKRESPRGATPAIQTAAGGSEGGQGTSDGQSEGASSIGQRPIAKGAVRRVQKRRQRQLNQANAGPLKTEHTVNYNVNPTMRHSEIPALLLGYLQFFVNAAVVFFVLYLAIQFVLTVRRDVQDKMAEASIDILQEISECSQLYLTNRCDPSLRVPAMGAPCRAWEACMSRDPTIVGRTNVLAETFAGVINSFVDPISWKTMGFTLVTLSFLIILTNSALFNLRLRAAPEAAPPATPQHMYPPIHAPFMPGGPHRLHQTYLNHGYPQTLTSGPCGQEQTDDQGGQAPLQIEEGDRKKKGWWR